MPNKSIGVLKEVTGMDIGDLEPILDLYDETKIPVEQQGKAMHMTGKQFRQYGEKSAEIYVQAASESAAKAKSEADRAKGYADTIEIDYDYIEEARTDAQTSATEAAGSAAAALKSQQAASQSEKNAASSETKAKASQDAALASQTAAAASASQAATSATNAAASAKTATDKASAASTSATNAASSASQAATSASNAADSEEAAAASQTAAKASENAAKSSQTEAAKSATAAAASQTAAANSASAAATSATEASESKTAAASSASAAATSASNASKSETAAKSSQTAAANSATAASGSAGTAKTHADAAKTSADAAKTSETNAEKSATEAKDAATLAQSIAQGQKGYYDTPDKLRTANPSGESGDWAIVGSTDTIWVWDSDTSAWKDSHQTTDLSNYYTKEQTDTKLATKQDVLSLTGSSSVDEFGGSTAKVELKYFTIDLMSSTRYYTTFAKISKVAASDTSLSILMSGFNGDKHISALVSVSTNGQKPLMSVSFIEQIKPENIHFGFYEDDQYVYFALSKQSWLARTTIILLSTMASKTIDYTFGNINTVSQEPVGWTEVAAVDIQGMAPVQSVNGHTGKVQIAIPEASATSPKPPAASASAGTETKFARGDHVHPVQTDVSGNAGTATKLATPRSLKTNLGSTAAVTFDGSADQNSIPVTGTLPVGNGGTGRTSISNITANLASTTAANSLAGNIGVSGILPVGNGGTGNTTGKAPTAGAADTAAKLATPRNINGIAFDGSKDITLPMPTQYQANGFLLNCQGDYIKGYGTASVLIDPTGFVTVYFSISITSSDKNNQTFFWGLNRDLLTRENSKIPKITPTSGGVAYIIHSSTTNLNGFGASLSVSTENGATQFWRPTRMYKEDGTQGTWANTSFSVNDRLIGVCYGTVSTNAGDEPLPGPEIMDDDEGGGNVGILEDRAEPDVSVESDKQVNENSDEVM